MYVDRDGGKSFDQKVVLSNAERKTVEQLGTELEEQRELAANRLVELEKTSNLYKEALKVSRDDDDDALQAANGVFEGWEGVADSA